MNNEKVDGRNAERLMKLLMDGENIQSIKVSGILDWTKLFGKEYAEFDNLELDVAYQNLRDLIMNYREWVEGPDSPRPHPCKDPL